MKIKETDLSISKTESYSQYKIFVRHNPSGCTAKALGSNIVSVTLEAKARLQRKIDNLTQIDIPAACSGRNPI